VGHLRFRGYVGRSFESPWPSSHFTTHECLREPGSCHVSVRAYLMMHKGYTTHISCSSAGHLYRASPKARLGSKPPRMRPFRITSFLSSSGCSERTLQRRQLCGSNQSLWNSPVGFFHVPPCLVLAENLDFPRSFAVSTFFPDTRNCTTVTSTCNVEISSRGIEDG